MIYLLVSIKDRSIEAYHHIACVRAQGEAMRNFLDVIQNKDTPFGKHPDDYDLYIVGTFDDQTGEIKPAPPEKIADGKTLSHSQTLQ